MQLAHTLQQQIQSHAAATRKHFETCFTLGESYPNEMPSWFSDTAVPLTDEEVPLDLRLYCNWHPVHERRLGDWYWYPPDHVLRFPDEDSYLLAAHDRHNQIIYYQAARRWVVQEKDADPKCYTSLVDVLNGVSSAHP